MSALLVKLAWGLFAKIAVPSVFQKVSAEILDGIAKSTKTKVDDRLLKPVIDILRK